MSEEPIQHVIARVIDPDGMYSERDVLRLARECARLEARYLPMLAELARLRRYATHLPSCAKNRYPFSNLQDPAYTKCDCGYSELT